jgi:hypothetical protein
LIPFIESQAASAPLIFPHHFLFRVQFSALIHSGFSSYSSILSLFPSVRYSAPPPSAT